MTRASRPAEQLPLMMSVDASVAVQLDRDRATWYAQEQHDRANEAEARANRIEEENAQLRDALKAAEARNLELQRELILAQTLSRTWQIQLELLRRTDLPTPRARPSKDMLTDLLVLAHPDKWSQGQPATALAHEVSVLVNRLRQGATP